MCGVLEPRLSRRPGENLTADPYFTDSLRALMFISTKPVSADRVNFIRWKTPSN